MPSILASLIAGVSEHSVQRTREEYFRTVDHMVSVATTQNAIVAN